jgi:TRAP-type uncharacterized transport system fused permease subunit
LWKTAITFSSAAVSLVFIAAAIERYPKWCATWWSRVILVIGAVFMISPNLWATAIGIVIAAIAIGANRMVHERALA